MKINDIFGANLRSLCSIKASIAEVARDLDLTKVQMARLLNGSSTPKPAVLKRVCDYFSVDARIVLEPLDTSAIERLRAGKPYIHDNGTTAEISQSMLDATAYVLGTRAPFAANTEILDGFYAMWRRSMSSPEHFIKNYFIVKSVNQAKVARGVDYAPFIKRTTGVSSPSREREFKGFVQGDASSMAVYFMHALPWERATLMVAHSDLPYPSSRKFGVTLTASAKRHDRCRIMNCMIEYLPGGLSEAIGQMRAYRKIAPDFYMTGNDIPDDIYAALTAPIA